MHWVAMAHRDRTELFDRRLRECALWMRIAVTTIFLLANFDDAARMPAVLEDCKHCAQRLRDDIFEVSVYRAKYPQRIERHMGPGCLPDVLGHRRGRAIQYAVLAAADAAPSTGSAPA